MPQQIDVPGMGVVEFPDGMSDAQIATAIKANMPKPSVGEGLKEVGRVADKTVRGGLTALPGMLGDVGLAGLRAAANAKPENLPSAGIFGLPALITKLLGGDNEAIKGTKFGDATNAIQTVAGALPPLSQPQSNLGKAVGNVGEATVSTMAGGGVGTLGQKALIGMGSGAGGEAASRAFGDNALTRVAGSIAGGGIVAGAQALRPNSDKLVRQATEHMTDADWQKAKAMEDVLNAQKIPHVKSQLLGPRSTLDDVVATASANPAVRPKLITATEGGPQAAEKAVEDFTMKNLPAAGVKNRSEVLTDVQQAADNRLRAIKDESNQAFQRKMPAKSTEYDQGRVKTLYNSLKQLADDPRFGDTADTGKAITKFADRLVDSREWDLSKVHPVIMGRAQAAAKEAGTALDPSTIPGAKLVTNFVTNAHKINNLNKEAKLMASSDDFKGLPLTDIRRIMNQATPEFERARMAKTAIMEDKFNPTSQGLTGQLAQMGGGVKLDKQTAKDSALRLVFDPTKPQGDGIRDLGKQMGGEQVGELLREHIHRTMQQVLATEDKSPRRFHQALYETTAQKENINAALEVTARQYKMNPAVVQHGFQRLITALDSFKDLKLAAGVSPGTTAAVAGQNVVSQVATPLTGTRRFFEQHVTAKSYNAIADLVTSPQGLAKLQAIASAPKQESVRQLAIGVLTSGMQGPKE